MGKGEREEIKAEMGRDEDREGRKGGKAWKMRRGNSAMVVGE